MFAVIGLHYWIRPDGLPRCFDKITAHQSMGTHCNTGALLVVATLMDTRCQANITRQMFYAFKASQIAKLADDTAGHDPTYSRNTFLEIIILLVMLAAIGTDL